MAAAMIASSVVSGGSSKTFALKRRCIGGIWKYVSMSQELMLVAVINSPYVSTHLISAYQACGFVNFNFFDSLVDLLPTAAQDGKGYDALYDNAQYHPYIFSNPAD